MTEEQQRPNKSSIGLVVDDKKIILFAVGDLRSNSLSKTELVEDEDLEWPEPLQPDVIYSQPPVVDRTFRGYRILEPGETARGGKELYAMEKDQGLPEITLDLAPIQESLDHPAGYNQDFEMEPPVARMFTERSRRVSPGLDFYRPQATQVPSRRLGKIRRDVPRMRSVVPVGGYLQGHQVQDNQQKISNITTTRGPPLIHQAQPTSRLAMALRNEAMSQPVTKYREYRASDGPVAGPSNEVFLTSEEVEAHRRQGSRRREEERLDEEARFREEARLKYHRFRG